MVPRDHARPRIISEQNQRAYPHDVLVRILGSVYRDDGLGFRVLGLGATIPLLLGGGQMPS